MTSAVSDDEGISNTNTNNIKTNNTDTTTITMSDAPTTTTEKLGKRSASLDLVSNGVLGLSALLDNDLNKDTTNHESSSNSPNKKMRTTEHIGKLSQLGFYFIFTRLYLFYKNNIKTKNQVVEKKK